MFQNVLPCKNALACLSVAVWATVAVASPADAIRANRWADAAAEAGGWPDPVAARLVAYYRALAPDAASYTDVVAVQKDDADWPAADTLERRRQEALAREPDPAVLAQACQTPLTWPPALLHCADVALDPTSAAALARRAWPGITDPGQETAFLQRWGSTLGPADDLDKFDALAWAGSPAAANQLPRLAAANAPDAAARLAARRDDPRAPTLVAALRDRSVGTQFDYARFLRRANRLSEARAALQSIAPADAEAHAADIWAEQAILARRLLRDNDAASAYAVVAAHPPLAPERQADADFLAGFIALRFLSDPARAAQHFTALAGSRAAITQGRAHYWLARATEAAGGDPAQEYAAAAAWPLTYYGQRAALEAGEAPHQLAARIARTADPVWTDAQADAVNASIFVRAAITLAAWGDSRRAVTFLTHAETRFTEPAPRALLAQLADGMGAPYGAVAVARRMGVDGAVLPQRGWPIPFQPPAPPDEAFSLGIMRQESSFDPAALSGSGARGLMQLMPATAQATAAATGAPATPLSDPRVNMRLGTAYLQSLLTQFNDRALAAAAYNAGPHRVTEWLTQNGDPRTGAVSLIDWIELIPFNETRNYVQRVQESATIYAARLGAQ